MSTLVIIFGFYLLFGQYFPWLSFSFLFRYFRHIGGDACHCRNQWPYNGEMYYNCSVTPDWPKKKWCYVNDGAQCNDAHDSIASIHETRKWLECDNTNTEKSFDQTVRPKLLRGEVGQERIRLLRALPAGDGMCRCGCGLLCRCGCGYCFFFNFAFIFFIFLSHDRRFSRKRNRYDILLYFDRRMGPTVGFGNRPVWFSTNHHDTLRQTSVNHDTTWRLFGQWQKHGTGP